MAQGNHRILVVDDDAPVRAMFATGLSQYGYECATAASADEANQILQLEDFDLLLLDITMPGKTGLFLLPELVERYPDMAVIMVTGNDELETAVYAMRQGADDYLAKPVPLNLLVYRTEKVLARRALLLENKEYHAHLEHMVSELNLRLGQNRRVLVALNALVQSLIAREQHTPEAYAGLQRAVTDIDSGLDSLADLAKGIVIEAPEARSPA